VNDGEIVMKLRRQCKELRVSSEWFNPLFEKDLSPTVHNRSIEKRADATLVALADALNASKVFTLDHKDFSVYRFQQKKRFTLIPPSLVS